MRKVIGLTGGIASGKSTVSLMLKARGCYICDADAISRTLLMPGGAAYEKTKEAFPQYVGKDGLFDRKALGSYVFSNEEELKKLNSITHPIIGRLIREDIDGRDGIIIIDAPLLIEVGLDKLCDKVWLVVADRETRIKRAASRSGLSQEQTAARIDNQMTDDEKLKYADVVIDNSGSIEELEKRIDELFREETDGSKKA